jgi:hypothetical protein
MTAGVSVRSGAVEAGPALARELAYETQLIDSRWDGRPAPTYTLPRVAQLAMVEAGPAARAQRRPAGGAAYAPRGRTPAGVRLDDERWVAVSTEDLTVRADVAPAGSRSDTMRALADYLAAHPAERDDLQVVPLSAARAA